MYRAKNRKIKQKNLKDPVYKALIQDTRRRSTYSIGTTEYNLTLESQDSKCAICKVRGLQLDIDHDHSDNTVRGLLCNPCNVGFDKLNESVTNIQKAIVYLIHT